MRMFLWLLGVLVGVRCSAQEIRLLPMESVRVPVTYNRMTNLVFPVAIRTAVTVSREVVVRRPGGVDNVLEMQAAGRELTPTNLSIYGKDGKLYAFELFYADSPSVVNFKVIAGVRPMVHLTGCAVPETQLAADADSLALLPAFVHAQAGDGQVCLRVKGVYVADSLLWFCLSVINRSAVPYRPEFVRLSVTDEGRVRRMARQSRVLDPAYAVVPAVVEREVSFAVGYPLFTIGRDQRVVLQLAEVNGGRTMRVRMRRRVLLRAR